MHRPGDAWRRPSYYGLDSGEGRFNMLLGNGAERRETGSPRGNLETGV